MRLSEWKDSTGNTVSTGSSNTMIGVKTSSKSNNSFEERFRRLLRYHVKHNSLSLDRVLNMKIYDDGFAYTEHRDKKDEVDVIVHIDPSSEAWQLKVYINRKQEVDFTGTGYVELLKWLRKYLVLPVAGTPEYSNILHEWLDSNGKKINTSSATNKSFKKRLNKLINYYGQHPPANVDFITVNLLTTDTLDFTEFYDDRSSSVYNIYIGPTTEAWRLKIYEGKKLKDDLAGTGWPELLKTLRPYITVPVVSTQEYKDLLTESLTESIETVPEKLYHATYRQFLKSIQQKGLGNTKRKMWSDSVRGVVYLADDPWVAESYAETAEWPEDREDPDAYYDNIIILEIDTSKLDSSKIKIDSNVLLNEGEENSTWEYHGIIPWEAIKIFNSSIAEDFKLYENLWD